MNLGCFFSEPKNLDHLKLPKKDHELVLSTIYYSNLFPAFIKDNKDLDPLEIFIKKPIKYRHRMTRFWDPLCPHQSEPAQKTWGKNFGIQVVEWLLEEEKKHLTELRSKQRNKENLQSISNNHRSKVLGLT